MSEEFGFFYPENGERVSVLAFESAQKAIEFWKYCRSTWGRIRSPDLAAFMSPRGEIVVVRPIKERSR